MFRRLVRECCQVRQLVGNVGASKLRLRYSCKNCRMESIPFGEEVFRAVSLRPESSAEAVGLIANLKSEQPRTENLMGSSCFAHRVLDRPLAEVQPIETRPVRGVE